jgi:hypothetical protein
MSYARNDQVSAVSDLIAMDGEVINIAGRNYRAHIEVGANTMEASEFGLHSRDETILATIINRGDPPRETESAMRGGKKYRISSINKSGEKILTLTLTND